MSVSFATYQDCVRGRSLWTPSMLRWLDEHVVGYAPNEQAHSEVHRLIDLLDVQNIALQCFKCLPMVAS